MNIETGLGAPRWFNILIPMLLLYLCATTGELKVYLRGSPSRAMRTEISSSTLKVTVPNVMEFSLTDQCSPKDPKLVIYNRLGKCGSSSMKRMLLELSQSNKFQFEFSGHFDVKPSDWNKDPGIVRAFNASATGKRAMYVNHVPYFGDLYAIGPLLPQPTYIQLVREPISRVVSQFYYGGQASRGEKGKQLVEKMNKMLGLPLNSTLDLDKCLAMAEKPKKCVSTNLMTSYFCGHAKECQDPSSPEALALAVSHLNRYAVVGILEDMPATLSLLSKLLPHFFSGADASAFAQERKGATTRVELTDEARSIMEQLNSNDVALYKIIVQKFNKDVERCLPFSR